MKILYFYQYYATPKGSWGTRVHEFARDWVKQGHQVTVVTSIYDKSDLRAQGLVSDQQFEGVNVKVLNVLTSNKQSMKQRVISFMEYALLSSWYAMTLPADVVVASSGPISVGIPGLVARYLRGRKLVFEVRDLWLQLAIELGLIRHPLLKKLTCWFEKVCYRASSLIITLSPGMSEQIAQDHPNAQLISVPNAADNALFGAPPKNDWQYPDWIGKRRVAIYSGNIGYVNNSELLFEAARILHQRGRDDILILLIGDGQQREQLDRRQREGSISNFHIQSLMPKEELVNWVQNALCCMIPLQTTPVLNTASPNKLFDSLAAGVPVIQTTNGWIKTLVEEGDCGFNINPSSPQELADRLLQLADEPKTRARMGHNAKRLAREQFDKSLLATRMQKALEQL